MSMTTSEAASLLGVSRRRVSELARKGQLPAHQIASGTWIINAFDLANWRKVSSQNGRPWNTATVKSVLLALSGESARPSFRVSKLIYETDAKSIGRQIGRLKRVRRVALHTTDLLAELRPTGDSFDYLAGKRLGASSLFEGYPPTSDWAQRLRAIDSEIGSVLLHQWAEGRDPGFDHVPVALAAVDMANSLDPRSREAGLTLLEQLRSDFLQKAKS